jgi:hypothetical protein
VPPAHPAIPGDQAAWAQQRTTWLQALREKSFRGWPTEAEPFQLAPVSGKTTGAIHESYWEFNSQSTIRLPLRVFYTGAPADVKRIVVYIADEKAWTDPSPAPPPYAAAIERGELALVMLAPRGIGPTAATASAADQNQLRRRYLLLGQTVDGMRVWDIRRAIDALRSAPEFTGQPLVLAGVRDQAINALYASLFIDGLAGLELHSPPVSHQSGPDYLNVLRFLDVPQAVAMAAERQPVALRGAQRDDWAWTTKAAQQLGWPAERLTFP